FIPMPFYPKILLATFLVLFTHIVFAQNGIIKGKITDAYSNKALSGVTITIQGLPKAAKTDSLGNYTFQELNPGVYNLVFSFLGYKRKSVYDIAVSNFKPAIFDLTLEAEASTLDEVNIQAPKFLKPLESPLSLRTIGATEIKRNPGGNRDISKVIQSLPGVSAPVSFRNDIII